jgi:hypothetical protein
MYAFCEKRFCSYTHRAGFWLTFAALILTLLAGCTVCFGRRRERMYNATTYPSTYETGAKKPGFLSRFRRRA